MGEAGEVVFDVAGVADRVRLAEEINEADLEAAELIEDETVIGEVVGAEGVGEFPREHGLRHALHGIEFAGENFFSEVSAVRAASARRVRRAKSRGVPYWKSFAMSWRSRASWVAPEKNCVPVAESGSARTQSSARALTRRSKAGLGAAWAERERRREAERRRARKREGMARE